MNETNPATPLRPFSIAIASTDSAEKDTLWSISALSLADALRRIAADLGKDVEHYGSPEANMLSVAYTDGSGSRVNAVLVATEAVTPPIAKDINRYAVQAGVSPEAALILATAERAGWTGVKLQSWDAGKAVPSGRDPQDGRVKPIPLKVYTISHAVTGELFLSCAARDADAAIAVFAARTGRVLPRTYGRALPAPEHSRSLEGLDNRRYSEFLQVRALDGLAAPERWAYQLGKAAFWRDERVAPRFGSATARALLQLQVGSTLTPERQEEIRRAFAEGWRQGESDRDIDRSEAAHYRALGI